MAADAATAATDAAVKGENRRDHYGFLLNVSLRMIAPTGVPIRAAVALSGNNRYYRYGLMPGRHYVV